MLTTAHDRRQDILALEPRLLDWANALTRDPIEAQALVHETLALAGNADHRPPGSLTSRAWIHRILRERFYSVERDRNYRRSRTAVIEMEQLRKRALAQAGTEASDAL
jgi:DNA-directed RNA polymerase specialized sigma24 family protein